MTKCQTGLKKQLMIKINKKIVLVIKDSFKLTVKSTLIV